MRFGGIALAAVLMLGACSGDPTPKEPTGSPSKPTPTSTATLPAMPDQAKEDSPEGAVAFVTHWVEVFNYAAVTGDVGELSRLSSPECEGCQRYIDQVRATYDAGGFYRGGDWSWGELKLVGDNDEVVITTTITVAAGERSSGDGKVVREDQSSSVIGFALPPAAPWKVEQLFLGDGQ